MNIEQLLYLLGLAHKDNIDLIQLTIRRKNTFFNALIDIMKVHHAVSKILI